MLDELINLHHQVLSAIDGRHKRFLYEQVDWDNQAICIYGARGVGKTTMLCQYLQKKYRSVENALYISADNIHVLSNGLLTVASRYFDLGGQALFIDEVHKYPNWSIEIKNIIDSYRKKQIIFSGSSAMELKQSQADLSRRVLYYELPGLSFREYLKFIDVIDVEPKSLDYLLENHVGFASELSNIEILKYFNHYLTHGFYPYFSENESSYLIKLNNVIEQVITEDIAVARGLKAKTLLILKKLLWLVATSSCLKPNIDKIAKNLEASRDIVYSGFNYLAQSGLITNVYPKAQGMKLIRKPGKIFMNNTNLLEAVNGTLSLPHDIGSVRETFFANQLQVRHALHTHDKADFLVDERFVFEVGGKNKNEEQIKNIENSYLALDGIKVGMSKHIPLYLFGFLY